MFFWNSLAFSMIQRMLAIWSLVLLPFLKPAWTSEDHSSHIAEAWLGEFWALLYQRVRWVQLCSSLSILWHCLSLGLEWKLTFSTPVATAELIALISANFVVMWIHLQSFHMLVSHFHVFCKFFLYILKILAFLFLVFCEYFSR